MSIIIEKGDKFYIRTKYGGITYGEVADVYENKVFDVEARKITVKYIIVSTNGVRYNFVEDKVNIISGDMSDKQIELLTALSNAAKNKKDLIAKKQLQFEEMKINGAFDNLLKHNER